MKTLLAICMIVAAPYALADENPAHIPPASSTVKGEVLEVTNVETYTYLRLRTKDGETWAAVSTAPVKKGDEITLENVMVMKDFESKSLKKTFPTILFGTLGGAATGTSGYDMATPHSGIVKSTNGADVHVAKASGANSRTVAEIVTQSAALKDKPVLVRGRVVKYNPDIMGKNWVHLRDGSGSAANNTNDILVTTTDQTKLGDVVTAKGVIHTDKDFGAGYSYKVLIEAATLQP
jgi:hypothetical protein